MLKLRLVIVTLYAFTLSGCLEDFVRSMITVSPRDGEPGFSDGGISFDGEVPDRLTVSSANPEHGPFVGGTEVVIYGSGFTVDTVVTVGGKEVPSTETQPLSPVAIKIITPPGEVGPVDMEISTPTEKAILLHGFRYDAVALDPESGPAAGGTLVTLMGQDVGFVAGMELLLGGAPMTDVEVVSTSVLRARTPPGASGPATLEFKPAGQAALQIEGAFSYYTSTNPKSGGMGGGPIEGSLTVSVLNWFTRQPVAGAQVVVQKGRALTLTGMADAQGIATFSTESLEGPLTVSAGQQEFESASIVTFDARDLTIFLQPIVSPEPGPMPPGVLAGIIQGHVLFGGTTGAGSDKWKIVPEPKLGQVKRTYVYTSSSLSYGPQRPVGSGTIDFEDTGATAWPFNLTVRPGAMAVYAVAGIYTKTLDRFDPYAMGITRGVLVGPGELVDTNILVNIPLTETLQVELEDLPDGVGRYRLQLAISLGSDGVLMRMDHEISGEGQLSSITLGRLPGFQHQGLTDASYTVNVLLESLTPTGLPLSQATVRSVQPVQGKVVVDQFLGVPRPLKPLPGAALEGNTLSWTSDGAAASFAITTLSLPDETPIWRIISRGDVTQVKLPDPVAFGLPQWPQGPLIWRQWLARIPGFDFDSFNYSHFNSNYWDRWSLEEMQLVIP